MQINAILQKCHDLIGQFVDFLQDFCAQFRTVHVDPLEQKWIKIALLIIALLVGIIAIDAFFHGINPPSKVETIDSARLHLSKEFAESNLGVQLDDKGAIVVRMVAGRYSFFPKHISVPAETKLTFRWVSMDVLHGVHIPMTNMSTMIVPGYVAEITTSFPKPGEYPVLCNEYCGLGHNHMWSNISVIAKEDWKAPANIIANKDANNG
ncbi:putative cytochrome c oxidase, subunit II (CbaB) [Methyloglobulus morosus KoM1]|uniref:Putative cytochrome c oxidase, subunit II (CbaB) n=1 Tax=Methyloglobulus morosus KoM1 TaxID=1116472 RepID=V5BWP3_9GAMM|nr:putative cytochrome c oxidase, subunit II (CbaB) [Methyloglobulus morosus]ESS72279.1 putative cytochrome c oxidase, subunit II (CbaB) [Methyloglobulus morosus KoM1]